MSTGPQPDINGLLFVKAPCHECADTEAQSVDEEDSYGRLSLVPESPEESVRDDMSWVATRPS